MFNDGYLDHDKEHIIQLFKLFDSQKHECKKLGLGSTRFKSLLYWCDKEKRMFTSVLYYFSFKGIKITLGYRYGAEGVIRLLKDDRPQQGRSCRQM